MKLLATLPVLLILTVPAPAQDDGRFGLMISSLVPAVRQANADGAGGAGVGFRRTVANGDHQIPVLFIARILS